MILNNAPANEAIMSNVGEIGEFRIRNSAKAFNILSSGLYANKIRAIVRELSCNAVDSHAAAGKHDVPFEVHMPNALEPHFSIRDFGTGLSHEQVTQIYTTYFESTKTNSNEFIGALGLGSKSPFSYTDNFTVTAIQDGKKGIYSAFINGEGVPSIALMMTEETDEPTGVEIKFSVNDRYDYTKFKEEAQEVYQHFKLKPTVTGCTSFQIPTIVYETENLIDGVHVVDTNKNRYRSASVAVMGNIAYPINVPNPEQLGPYREMLNCGLEMHFGIGELDFQASREGLSYIPQTIESIKKKLECISTALATRIKTDAEAIDNLWDRALFLEAKNNHPLWSSSVMKYAKESKLQTVDPDQNRWNFLKKFKIPLDEMESKYNISIAAFTRSRGSSTCMQVKHDSRQERSNAGTWETHTAWHFTVSPDSDFIINDTTVGGGERAKYHYRKNEFESYQRVVYVLQKADNSKDMNTDQFFTDICNPPENRRKLLSALDQKPRKDSSVGRNVSILGMEKKRRGYSNDVIVWTDAGKIDSFDATKTYYYVPLTGYTMITSAKDGYTDAKTLVEHLKESGMAAFANIKVFGVRKTDLPEVKKLANWVNIEEHIAKTIKVPDHNILMSIVLQEYTMKAFAFMGSPYSTTMKVDHSSIKKGSPFKEYVKKYDDFKRIKFSEHAMRSLYSAYGTSINFDMTTAVKAIVQEHNAVRNRYPLLDGISSDASSSAIAEYVNLIDNVKGI